MLGTRTKQVFAYGKRGHRIVNVSEDREHLGASKAATSSATSTSNFLSPSPRVVRKVKRISPAKHSPTALTKKRTRVRQIIDSSPKCKPTRPTRSSMKPESIDLCTPTPARRPLGAFHPNVPHSPAPTPKPRAQGKGTPLGAGTKLRKPFSPFVDVDIIVLDDAGRRVSQERRVSRTDVQANPIGNKGEQLVKTIILDDSETEEEGVVEPAKRKALKAKKIVISSDESETDEGDVTPEAPLSNALTSLKPIPRLQVEVLIPPIPPPRTKPPPLEPKLAIAPAFPSQSTQYHPLDLHSPRVKPRQLTPIRRGSRSAFGQLPIAPTPSTPTDLDLSLDFSELLLSPTASLVPIPQPVHLKPLLEECGQQAPHEFSAFIESFPFDPIVHTAAVDDTPVFRKIGEASYSEVFGIGEVVLKVIPLRDESACALPAMTEVEGPAPSDVRDVLKELIVTRELGEVCTGGGFIELLRGYVVRGRYPELLLGLWDEYDERKGSEGIRPDTFTVSQTYAIIVLPNGGPDLEAYVFPTPSRTGWRQACSLFWQVARALAQAEELVAFEHRDLHWGQILVKNIPPPPPPRRSKGSKARVQMDDASHGVKATVIDLGLARMDGEEGEGGAVHWTPFDEEIFQGEGDYQFDVYRMMRGWNGGEWEGFRPLSNVMWLHYLTLKLLHAKRLRPPKPTSAKMKATPAKAAAGFTERECYESLVEMESVLDKAVAVAKKAATAKKGRRKTVGVAKELKVAGPASAREVVEYAVGRGWIFKIGYY